MNVLNVREFTFPRKNRYSKEDLFYIGNGVWGDVPRLPLPPLQLFDDIEDIQECGGHFNKGYAVAAMRVDPDAWFFKCHFKDDPVMPACLQLDALWQLTGFFAGWAGGTGKGRAIGSGPSKFRAEITPDSRLVTYRIDVMKRVITRTRALVVAEGTINCDGARAAIVSELAVIVAQP